MKDKKLEIVEKDGVKSALVHIDDKTSLGLGEYATTHLADFMPALALGTREQRKAEASKQGGSKPSGEVKGEQIAKDYINTRYAIPKRN
jgi:hypothetical protein